MAFFLKKKNEELNVNKSYTTGFYIYAKQKPIKVYVVFSRPFVKIESDVITPISGKDYGLNMLCADTLDNVANMNHTLAEFSSYYWVWKNDLVSEYVGFFHYRRYLSFERKAISGESIEDFNWDYETVSNLLNSYDLVIPPKFRMGIDVYQQYCMHHEKLLLDKAIEIIRAKYPKEYIDAMDIALKNNYGYYCNLFICKREIFNKFMEFVFDIFEELKPYLRPNSQARALGFVGERLYIFFIHYIIKYTNYRVCETPQIYIYDNNRILIDNNIENILK